MKKALILILLFIIYLPDSASDDLFDFGQPYFETIGDNQDIPGSIVMTMVQDSKGFIWLGTQEGLIRYDGYRFKRYVHQPLKKDSISENFISYLFLAENGDVWVGTNGDGISIYNHQTDSFTRLNHRLGSKDLTGNAIYVIANDFRGNLYVGSKRGIDYIDIKTGVVKKLDVPNCFIEKNI